MSTPSCQPCVRFVLVENVRVSLTFAVGTSRCRIVAEGLRTEESYLVDPASSHMLVSKIKPCMSKYKLICTVKLRMAH